MVSRIKLQIIMKLSILKVNLKASQFSTLPQNPAEHSRYGNTKTHSPHWSKTLQNTAGTVTPRHITTLELSHKQELVISGLQKSGPGGRVRAGQPSWFICVSVSTAVSERRRRTLKFIHSAMLF